MRSAELLTKYAEAVTRLDRLSNSLAMETMNPPMIRENRPAYDARVIQLRKEIAGAQELVDLLREQILERMH